MSTPGTQMAMCTVCDKVKSGPLLVVKPGKLPPSFICSDCLETRGASDNY